MISQTKGEAVFNVINRFLLLLFALCMIIPLMHVFSVSLSSTFAVDRKQVFLFPVGFTFASWKYTLGLSELWVSVRLTVFVTLSGTFLALLINALMAYPLSKRNFALSKILLYAVVVSMIFKSPTIPYFLTLRSIGMIDSVWVLILPHILSSYNLIIMVTFFRQIPDELEEAAVIEGCGYFRLLFNIIIPCSKAVIGTLSLFYAVTVWNQFSHPLMFINSVRLFPLQLKIRQYISSGASELMGLFAGNAAQRQYNSETVKATIVLFSLIPIACVYPFVQKHFVKGVTLGGIKG